MLNRNAIVATTLAALASMHIATASAQERAGRAALANPVDRSPIKKILTAWPNRPKLGANEMMAKYGLPQEATTEKLVWHNQGPYKRIMVTREEIPHDFPKPHMDFLEHTIEYNVPLDKTAELIEFDGSSTINRTAGELSARCDLEGHNILTLNLDHDIVTGKKSVKEARKAFGEIVVQDVKGEHPPYVEALQFQPTGKSARFPDEPVIPGSPVRLMQEKGERAGMDDAEVLAFVIAVDDNEVLAAAEAQKKKLSPEVLSYAKMLHMEHGKNQEQVMALGLKLDITPSDTPEVDKLRAKGAGELAALVPLDGKEFEQAYLAAMVKGHTEALAMIDGQLMKAAKAEKLQEQLKVTRGHVAAHLEQAKQLQGPPKR